jgi:hypothetical protein
LVLGILEQYATAKIRVFFPISAISYDVEKPRAPDPFRSIEFTADVEATFKILTHTQLEALKQMVAELAGTREAQNSFASMRLRAAVIAHLGPIFHRRRFSSYFQRIKL